MVWSGHKGSAELILLDPSQLSEYLAVGDCWCRALGDASSPACARGQQARRGCGRGLGALAWVYNKHWARRHQLYLDSAYSHM